MAQSAQSALAQCTRSLQSLSVSRPQIHCLYRRPITISESSRNAAVAISQQQIRGYAAAKKDKGNNKAKPRSAADRKEAQKAAKKKKLRSSYTYPDMKQAEQFNLLDAMRYIRAFEVGHPSTSPKYELHLRLKTLKNGAVIRNRFRLPHPVKTDLRICVICPPDSKAASAARAAGAVLVGEDEVFEAVKAGEINFDRCLCHTDSLPKLGKSGIARILGPRGLMPSAKLGTVTKDVSSSVRDMVGGSEYRERMGVIRMAIGQLAFSPGDLQANIRAFLEQVKKDMAGLSDRINKELLEVVLSSTHAPGFSLSGEFGGANSVGQKDLVG